MTEQLKNAIERQPISTRNKVSFKSGQAAIFGAILGNNREPARNMDFRQDYGYPVRHAARAVYHTAVLCNPQYFRCVDSGVMNGQHSEERTGHRIPAIFVQKQGELQIRSGPQFWCNFRQ